MEKVNINNIIEVDGKSYTESTSEFELKIESRASDFIWHKAKFTNNGDRTIKFGVFHFEIKAFDGIPGENIRIYKEGWIMTSAAASVRYGEKDFEADPDYLKFAVTQPEDYTSDEINNFSAEHVIVLNDKTTDYSLLAGLSALQINW